MNRIAFPPKDRLRNRIAGALGVAIGEHAGGPVALARRAAAKLG